MPSANCPVCGCDSLLAAWSIKGYEISRCSRCSHCFVSSEIGSFDGEYEKSYYEGSSDGTQSGYESYLTNADRRMRGFAQRLRELEQFTQGRGRLLDFGCAVGLFVKVAVDAGWDAIGYERSTWAANYGREHYGLKIESGSGESCAAFNGAFDVISMWDVLEHLEDPRGVMQQVAKWLKPGGVLALNTVDSASRGARIAGSRWRHLAPPHHLQYFTRESLRELLKSCGFRVVSLRSQGVFLGADSEQLPLGGLRAAIEEVATHWRMRPLANALNLIDEMEVVCRND